MKEEDIIVARKYEQDLKTLRGHKSSWEIGIQFNSDHRIELKTASFPTNTKLYGLDFHVAKALALYQLNKEIAILEQAISQL